MNKNQQSVMIVGHRGAHGLAPDNTIVGFTKGLEYGVDQIETDLRLSRDGVIVMAHDPDIADQAGQKLSVTKSTYAELKAHKPDLLTLTEAIKFVDRRARMMLEIKDHAATKPAIEIVRQFYEMGWQPSDFIIASFKYPPLAACKKGLPGVELVVLDDWSGVRATHRARKLHTPYLSMNQNYLWPGFVRAVSSHYKLYCYPSQNSWIPWYHPDPAKWVKVGLTGIITDNPERYHAKRSIVKADESHLSPARATDEQHQHILV